MYTITDGELPDDRKHLVFGQQLKVRDSVEWDCECIDRPVRQSTGQHSTKNFRSLDCPNCGWKPASAKATEAVNLQALGGSGNLSAENVHAILTKAKDLNLDGLRDQVIVRCFVVSL